MINWKVNDKDDKLIKAIAKRVMRVSNLDWDMTHIIMDLTACHLNGCPLDLEAMKNGSDFDLMHDVLGINHHLNRDNGTLENCFLPRFAA